MLEKCPKIGVRSYARDNLLFKPYQNGSKTPENQGFPGFYYI
nr:MAG: hypothetical protein [Bacteriophage sp.]